MLEVLLNSALFSNIALTLLHFLWQGLAVAVFLKIILAITPHQSSRARYAFSSFAMLANLLLPIITFFFLYQPELHDASQHSDTAPNHLLGFTLLANESTLYNDLLATLPYVTCAWIVTISFIASRLIIEMYSVNQLPKKYSHPPLAALNERFLHLVDRLNMTQKPKLVISLSVEVPMAIGWLKPVVLLPASMVTGLTPAQLDMLILHELAHIRRYDYLVNLLQSFVELLLFFHPAVYWVSKQMRVEREYCSDDIAVQHCGDALAYAHTLADTATLCQKHRHVIPTMAMAASGGDLKQRVIRLVNPQSCTSNIDKSKWLASLVIMLGLLIICSNELAKITYTDLTNDSHSIYEHNHALTTPAIASGYVPKIQQSLTTSNTAPDKTSKASFNKSTQADVESPKKNNVELSHKPALISKKIEDDALLSINAQPPASANIEKISKNNQAARKNTVKLPATKENSLTTATLENISSEVTKAPNNSEQKSPTVAQEKNIKQTPTNGDNKTLSYSSLVSLQQNNSQNKKNVGATINSPVNAVSDAKQGNAAQSGPDSTEIFTDKTAHAPKNSLANPYAQQLSELNLPPKYQDAVEKFEQQNKITSAKKPASLSNSEPSQVNNTVSFKKAQPIKMIEPKYPNSAQRKKVELDLLVNFSINKEGKVENIQIERKNRANYFKSSIISALEKWQFEPAKKNGAPIESKMAKIFSFNLNLY